MINTLNYAGSDKMKSLKYIYVVTHGYYILIISQANHSAIFFFKNQIMQDLKECLGYTNFRSTSLYKLLVPIATMFICNEGYSMLLKNLIEVMYNYPTLLVRVKRLKSTS